MILKVLLVIAVIGIVYFIFIKKKPSHTISKKKNIDASEMVECATCGVFVELDDTILSNAKYYCSKECVEKAK